MVTGEPNHGTALEACAASAPSPVMKTCRWPLERLVATAPKRRGHDSMGRERKCGASASRRSVPDLKFQSLRRASASMSAAGMPLAQRLPTTAPTLVPATTFTSRPCASSSSSTPMCARPCTEPLPRATPMRLPEGFTGAACGAGASGGHSCAAHAGNASANAISAGIAEWR